MSTTIIQQIAPANIEILVRGLSALSHFSKTLPNKIYLSLSSYNRNREWSNFKLDPKVQLNHNEKISLQCRRFVRERKWFCSRKRHVETEEGRKWVPSHLPLGLLFLLSPIFHCNKIKDGGYNSTNTNKVSPTQNTPALQAMKKSKVTGKSQDLCLWSWFPYHRSKTPMNSI